MRRPAAIVLVVMGGGLALWSVNRGPSRTCLDARAQHRPDAEAICNSGGGGSGHGGGSGYHGGYSSGSTAATAAIARGGFGAAGAHAAGS